LSFTTHPLQLKAFNHIMFGMITKSIIYEIIELRISSSNTNPHTLLVAQTII
jgi:hypothetical protein